MTYASKAPEVGQVIPDAVENIPGKAPFIYPLGWKPGDSLLPGQGTIQSVLDEEVRSGRITREEALESAQNSGLATGPGGYEPPIV